ncbi:hypothetical protein [uncultured Nostoc sp.]|uniref:hypothetical protein n=1 Tax=uncultured Nostoc sp. TaxID=340711 RepID=UPI0035C9AD00
MSEANIADRFDLTKWKTESLRMTAFLSPGSAITQQNWWEEICGSPPEVRSSQPRTGVQQDEGSFEDGNTQGRLILAVQPSRIDWLLALEAAPISFELLSVVSFSESVNSFTELMNRWLNVTPNLQRIAFGANLLLPFEDVKQAYEYLPAYFPLNKLDLKNAQDFNYRINRPRNVDDIPDLKINRLSSWSVMTSTTFQFTNAGSYTYSSTPSNVAIRLELDINTTIDFSGELSKDKLPEIFAKLVEYAKEIALKGDIL